MDEHITPLVWSTIAQYGILSASFAAARDILKAWGIAVSLKRLERLTYRFGHLGLQLFHNNTAHLVTTQTIPVLSL